MPFDIFSMTYLILITPYHRLHSISVEQTALTFNSAIIFIGKTHRVLFDLKYIDTVIKESYNFMSL